MAELSLEALAARIEALEKQVAELQPKPNTQDWRSVMGMFEKNEINQQIDQEAYKIREDQRKAALEGTES